LHEVTMPTLSQSQSIDRHSMKNKFLKHPISENNIVKGK
jgi:hypothetical protein